MAGEASGAAVSEGKVCVCGGEGGGGWSYFVMLSSCVIRQHIVCMFDVRVRACVGTQTQKAPGFVDLG